MCLQTLLHALPILDGIVDVTEEGDRIGMKSVGHHNDRGQCTDSELVSSVNTMALQDTSIVSTTCNPFTATTVPPITTIAATTKSARYDALTTATTDTITTVSTAPTDRIVPTTDLTTSVITATNAMAPSPLQKIADTDGSTPVHFAAAGGHVVCLWFMLSTHLANGNERECSICVHTSINATFSSSCCCNAVVVPECIYYILKKILYPPYLL